MEPALQSLAIAAGQNDIESSQSAHVLFPAAPSRDGERLPAGEEEQVLGTLKCVFLADKDQGAYDIKELIQSLNETENRETRNLALLAPVREVIDRLWRSGSDFMPQAAGILADASRDPSWRSPFGQSGVLEFFLRVAATYDVNDQLLFHTLRLIGNSCADTEENRQRIVQGNFTLLIISLFARRNLAHVTIPVLFNICNDFEPAKVQAAANGGSVSIMQLLLLGAVRGEASLSFTFELLQDLCQQEEGISISPDSALNMLLRISEDKSLEAVNFLHAAGSLVCYLEKERFQAVCVQNKLVESAIDILPRSYSYDGDQLDADDKMLFAQFRLKMTHALSDISAISNFTQIYPLGSSLLNILMSWLAKDEDQLQICSAVMLGNVAREDSICEAMVNNYAIHLPLIKILRNGDSRGPLLHAALGFLKNLAVFNGNKELLGRSGIIQTISPLLGQESVPQVRYLAASLTRQIISTSLSNVSFLLESLSPDENSPASNRTHLSRLLSLFSKTDSKPIKTEVGRAVAAVCRTIGQGSQNGDEATAKFATHLAERFYMLHKEMTKPLMEMLTQKEWPVVQSEGWFALALMASSSQGSFVAGECVNTGFVFQALQELITSELPSSVDDQQALKVREQRIKDRSNGIVLVNGLLKHSPPSLNGLAKDLFGDWMQDIAQRGIHQ